MEVCCCNINHGDISSEIPLKNKYLVTQELLNCVNKDILIKLCDKSGLKIKKNGTNSNGLIQAIVHQMDSQKTIFGVKLSNNPSFLKKCHSIIGKFIAVTDLAQDLLDKCQCLFYLDPNKTIQETVLSHIGKRKYPKYKIFNDECKSDMVIFPKKQTFSDYVEALKFRSEYDEIYVEYEQKKKKEKDSTELLKMIKQCAQS